jgi:hypothetical protein
MCDKCDELDAKIVRYRAIVDSAMDQLTNQRVAKLIEDLRVEKADLHRGPEKYPT